MAPINRNLINFLTTIDLQQYLSVFEEEEITIEILKDMTDENLRSIGIKTFGQRYRILQVQFIVQVSVIYSKLNIKAAREYTDVEEDRNIPNDEEHSGETTEEIEHGNNDIYPQNSEGVAEENDNNAESQVDFDRDEEENDEPVFYSEQLTTGRIAHHFLVGFYRFDRKSVFKSGLSYFNCSFPGCKDKIYARYHNDEGRNEERFFQTIQSFAILN